MKFRIFNYEEVTSTNDIAIKLIKEKKKQIGYVNALVQTKGRGTYGKRWVSKRGNLFGTLFFPLKEDYPSFSEFSIINPVIISEVMNYFCKKERVSIKWPNDIFVDKKKICGVLQELITLKRKKFLIIGIGINVLSNPNINLKYKSTNLFKVTKKKLPINKIIKLIILSYENFFKNINSYNYAYFKEKNNLMSIN